MDKHVYHLLLGCLFTFLTHAGSAQKLYVFSVIGPNERYRADRERLYQMADSLAFYGGYRQIRYDFSTQQVFVAPSVRKTLMNFTAENADEDIIWFHYAGRGYGSRQGAWPTLRMGTSELAAREILTILRSKPARTLFVTIDCANQPKEQRASEATSVRIRSQPVPSVVRPRPIGNNTAKQTDTLLTDRYRHLMQPPRIRQIIVMAAASHGQRAYRTNARGSVWLENFSRVIHDATHRTDIQTSWKQLQEQLSLLTQQRTRNRQTPQYNRQTITCCETDSLR